MPSSAIPTFYRIVRADPPDARDFLPAQVLGRPAPRGADAHLLALWSDGVSMFDTVERARMMARLYPRLGAFIARLEIETDDPHINSEKTLGPGHVTLRGAPETMLERVRSVQPV